MHLLPLSPLVTPSTLSPAPTFTRTLTGGSATVPGYKPKVSFDTFENPSDAALDSFTLQVSARRFLIQLLNFDWTGHV